MVFSALKAHQFFAKESWDNFKQIFDTYMNEASKVLLLSMSCFKNSLYCFHCPLGISYVEIS